MAELADAPDLGSGVYDVQVQVLLSALSYDVTLIAEYIFLTALLCGTPRAKAVRK